ncbi:hypothetical protein BU25DRAFT_172079 [Macroventuria anomochaeta]|uniref:Uncharacterized protein n=1 Tax=Macroventuria anomochaeta TaxID=301207 RepID=A0ACB6RPB0_9PLEO|nr:uncharacterized protein BU25DRAFT_172079 [Macroventuria anomochaeta]KAF2623658.1 hypothetical protein BU25DRAFT_172079 [Macroventuria anomochaeta]
MLPNSSLIIPMCSVLHPLLSSPCWDPMFISYLLQGLPILSSIICIKVVSTLGGIRFLEAVVLFWGLWRFTGTHFYQIIVIFE